MNICFPSLIFSSFISLRLEKMLFMISVFLNLLRFILWPIMWSVMENVPCLLAKHVFPVAECSVLCTRVRYGCSKMRSGAQVPCWSFVWFYPYVKLGRWCLILLLCCSVCHFWQCLLHRFGGSDVRCINVYNCYIFMVNWFFCNHNFFFFGLLWQFLSLVCFIWCSVSTPLSLGQNIFFPFVTLILFMSLDLWNVTFPALWHSLSLTFCFFLF